MNKPSRWLESLAWGVAALGSGVLLLLHVQSVRAEKEAENLRPAAAVMTSLPPARGTPGTSGLLRAAAQTSTRPEDDDLSTGNAVIGRLEIPALGLKVPILNDYDPDSLRRGVGRIKGTAVPGGLGNFAVAGHRDTYFRPLRRIARGMTMRVFASAGTFDYVVDRTEIVTPEDVDVLDIGNRPEMTLITCYPFNYIGAAPKRFIVHANLVSVAGEDPK